MIHEICESIFLNINNLSEQSVECLNKVYRNQKFKFNFVQI